jgi:hypothetical protein
VYERLDALAMLVIELAREFCLRVGAAWTLSAHLAAAQGSTVPPTVVDQLKAILTQLEG